MNIEISPIIIVNHNDCSELDLHNAIVEVGDNKLILSKDAIKALGTHPKDRIAVNY